eukprot:CAMPEP_0174366320 /NCGR_PEP_ID=MMETSP0811_2-20130205/80770_1 /TAXON_ID=73025 ORGANISM="Eutreptiella gymnastica-like, Strain CCMP1594" /NCGR_SAMPLE_ID=MMETSP0811_2 /ASSEMBLY_ACC=CAM_ASM_000667 /LENGTH=87 /DNA_ID=CAMNT_0015507775 /DNA_START=688 /DNA_END=948 /DNA_ORIENTATION=-
MTQQLVCVPLLLSKGSNSGGGWHCQACNARAWARQQTRQLSIEVLTGDIVVAKRPRLMLADVGDGRASYKRRTIPRSSLEVQGPRWN